MTTSESRVEDILMDLLDTYFELEDLKDMDPGYSEDKKELLKRKIGYYMVLLNEKTGMADPAKILN